MRRHTGAFSVVPGHEYAGVVVEVGTNVTNVRTGDRVVVDPNLECGDCRSCNKGWAHLCENLGAFGVITHGGFAELSLFSASAVHQIGTMSFRQAALAEPMGCVLNDMDAVHASWMNEALIFGAAPMGLLMGMALKAEGIGKIAFVDIAEMRRPQDYSAAENNSFDRSHRGIAEGARTTGRCLRFV